MNDKAFVREDYCEECWPNLPSSEQDDSVYSRWQTTYLDPSVANATPEGEFMPLLSFFYDALAATVPDSEAAAYVCALVLRRQKIFKFLREEKDEASGKSVLLFHDKHHDVQVKIVDPKVTEAKFREVKQMLEERLSQKDRANER